MQPIGWKVQPAGWIALAIAVGVVIVVMRRRRRVNDPVTAASPTQ